MIKTGWSRRGGRHDKVLRLLDREREVLLEGDVATLAEVVGTREALVSELLEAPEPPPAEFLEAIKEKAERNGRLLLASMAGLRSARDQIAELDRAAHSLKTYTADGAAIDVAGRRGSHDERR